MDKSLGQIAMGKIENGDALLDEQIARLAAIYDAVHNTAAAINDPTGARANAAKLACKSLVDAAMWAREAIGSPS